MEGFQIDSLPQTINRGIRFILKNSFLHVEAEHCLNSKGGSSKRSLSAPPGIIQAPLRGTTLMVRNIPTKICQRLFLELICGVFDDGMIDFLYLPLDFKSGKSLGYAFVNFVSEEGLNAFHKEFSGKRLCRSSSKELAITLAKMQGFEKNYNLFKTSSVMTYAPPEFRPMIKCESCGSLRPLSAEGAAYSVICSSVSCVRQ
jgi:hypothetical protein